MSEQGFMERLQSYREGQMDDQGLELAYIAFRKCGCVAGWIYDEPEYRSDSKEFLRKMKRRGCKIAHVQGSTMPEIVRFAGFECAACKKNERN